MKSLSPNAQEFVPLNITLGMIPGQTVQPNIYRTSAASTPVVGASASAAMAYLLANDNNNQMHLQNNSQYAVPAYINNFLPFYQQNPSVSNTNPVPNAGAVMQYSIYCNQDKAQQGVNASQAGAPLNTPGNNSNAKPMQVVYNSMPAPIIPRQNYLPHHHHHHHHHHSNHNTINFNYPQTPGVIGPIAQVIPNIPQVLKHPVPPPTAIPQAPPPPQPVYPGSPININHTNNQLAAQNGINHAHYNYNFTNNIHNNSNNKRKPQKQANNQKNYQKQSVINTQKFNPTDERNWPSLPSSKQTQKHSKSSDNKNEQLSDEDTDKVDDISKQTNIKTEPYLADENKLKKLIKNVNFIKTTVEQHYLSENNYKMSFRDSLLTKKTAPTKSVTVSAVNPTVTEEKTESTVSNPVKSEKTRRKRSKSKGSPSATRLDVNKQSNETNFDLSKENFPDLLDGTESNLIDRSRMSKSDRSNINSDAYSSDATLDAVVLKTKSNTQLNQKDDRAATGSNKKSHQPIKLEFANMISALEKGQQQEKFNPRYRFEVEMNKKRTPLVRSKSQVTSRNGIVPLVGSKLMKQQIVNPLDSTLIVKRGKEREKPKNKKHSTLKKIILKEREEKRRQRQEQAKLSELALLDLVDLNSPVAMNSADLMLSPRFNTQPVASVTDDNTDQTETDNEDSQNDKKEDSMTNNTVKNDENEEQENEDDDNESVKTFTLTAANTNENLDQLNESFNSQTKQNVEAEYQENKEHKSCSEKEDDDDDDADSVHNTEVMSNPMSPISQGSPISLGGYTPSPYTSLSMAAPDRALLSLEKLEEQVKQKIHSRKFREYCNQIINNDIDFICKNLLHEIVRFQDRLYHKNPIKAKMKRRYVMGIREVTKHLKLQKLKCVILAPNCEKIQSKGGLDDAINLIIQTSMEQNVPFVFALGRKGLGKAVNKLVPISVVGIFDYSGAEEYFKKLVELANNAKLAYQEMVEEFEKEECENLINMQSAAINSVNTDPVDLIKDPLLTTASSTNIYNSNSVLSCYPKIPSHMGHSRTPSNSSNISIEPYFHMNYHTHSRSASGNFNYGHTTTAAPIDTLMNNVATTSHARGHTRSASSGGNIDLNIHTNSSGHHWTHSRTASNCSNISFISRLSEPISEVGGSLGTLLVGSSASSSTTNLAPYNSSNQTISTFAAVQYYTEQVRQEMRECESETTNTNKQNTDDQHQQSTDESVLNTKDNSVNNVSSSLVNLHLGPINEIDAGNEADTEDYDNSYKEKNTKQKSDQND